MSALTKDRNTIFKHRGPVVPFKVNGGSKIYAGALVAVDAQGYLLPASDTAGLKVVGIADEQVDNTDGADGDVSCLVVTEAIAHFKNDGNVAQANVGGDCTVSDDQTVSVAATTVNDIVAGKVVSIESDGVFVKVAL